VFFPYLTIEVYKKIKGKRELVEKEEEKGG